LERSISYHPERDRRERSIYTRIYIYSQFNVRTCTGGNQQEQGKAREEKDNRRETEMYKTCSKLFSLA